MSSVYKMMISFIMFLGLIFVAIAFSNSILQVSAQTTMNNVAETSINKKIINGESRLNGILTDEDIVEKTVVDFVKASSYQNGDNHITVREKNGSFYVTAETKKMSNTYKIDID